MFKTNGCTNMSVQVDNRRISRYSLMILGRVMFTSLSFQILVASLENSDEANIPHFRGVWLNRRNKVQISVYNMVQWNPINTVTNGRENSFVRTSWGDHKAGLNVIE